MMWIFSFLYLIASYTAEISEGVDVGTSVITVTAIDKDLGENASIKYTISSGTNMVRVSCLKLSNTASLRLISAVSKILWSFWFQEDDMIACPRDLENLENNEKIL